MGTWNGWLIPLSSHFRFQFFILEICHSFLAVSFAILPQHYAMKKKEKRLPFYFQLFWFFTFN